MTHPVLDIRLTGDAPVMTHAEALRTTAPGRPLTVCLHGEAPVAELTALLATRGDLAGVLLMPGLQAETATAAGLAGWCRSQGLPFAVDLAVPVTADAAAFVLHGTGDLAGLVALTERLTAAKPEPIPVRWRIPLEAGLVYRLDNLTSLCAETGAQPVFVPPAGPLTGDDRLFAWDFIAYRVLEEEAEHVARADLAAYADLARALKDDTAPLPAPGAQLTPKSGQETGHGKQAALTTTLADLADVARVGIPGHLRSYLTPGPDADRGTAPMPFVLLIGAYGGEHIGDGAILGGVLNRIHARHGTTRAILMTQRPNHTRHLMPMLDVPVELEVWDYTPANITRALAGVDGVVFAGGPLTDLPKQLVRHLETVTRAKRRGLPFVMEGIGPGTFARKPSAVTARRLVELADRIAIRVKDDASRPVIAGIDFTIGRDPAFDYLETRGPVLSRLPAHEPAQIDALLKGTQGRKVVAINVRPIGSLFTAVQPGEDPVAVTKATEDRFEREFAKGLADFAAAQDAPPCFVFFPMNAIQFGMSDLRSAWRILRHLPKGTDFRIWQADASLDGVVALLRRVDCVISMRFHGAIFALSQGCNVIGIDYRIGKRDKVAAVLSDAGVGENCQRIDELRAGWLTDKLNTLCIPPHVDSAGTGQG